MPVSVDAKPLAVAVTVIPEGPEDGFSVREMTVPVKVAVVESLAVHPEAVTVLDAPALEKVKVVELESLLGVPVAVTEFDVPPLVNVKPSAPLAVNVQVPVFGVVTEHNVTELGLVTLTEVSLARKPVAVAVTRMPEGPFDGLKVRRGSMVKVAVAELLDVSVAVTVCDPPYASEMVTAQPEKLPPGLDAVQVPETVPLPVMAKETVSPAPKPVPLAVNRAVGSVPLEELRVSVGSGRTPTNSRP